jgi:hypothetical protein
LSLLLGGLADYLFELPEVLQYLLVKRLLLAQLVLLLAELLLQLCHGFLFHLLRLLQRLLKGEQSRVYMLAVEVLFKSIYRIKEGLVLCENLFLSVLELLLLRLDNVGLVAELLLEFEDVPLHAVEGVFKLIHVCDLQLFELRPQQSVLLHQLFLSRSQVLSPFGLLGDLSGKALDDLVDIVNLCLHLRQSAVELLLLLLQLLQVYSLLTHPLLFLIQLLLQLTVRGLKRKHMNSQLLLLAGGVVQVCFKLLPFLLQCSECTPEVLLAHRHLLVHAFEFTLDPFNLQLNTPAQILLLPQLLPQLNADFLLSLSLLPLPSAVFSSFFQTLLQAQQLLFLAAV